MKNRTWHDAEWSMKLIGCGRTGMIPLNNATILHCLVWPDRVRVRRTNVSLSMQSCSDFLLIMTDGENVYDCVWLVSEWDLCKWKRIWQEFLKMSSWRTDQSPQRFIFAWITGAVSRTINELNVRWVWTPDRKGYFKMYSFSGSNSARCLFDEQQETVV